MTRAPLLPLETITQRILVLRGLKVLLDADLAALYDVPTKRFNEQVRRNLERFPADFMFQLTEEEWGGLRSQIATLKTGRGQHRKYLPYVFTEHGAIMAAMIQNSPRATEVSVYVVRAFVRLRETLASNAELAKRLDDLEQKTEALAMRHDAFARNTRAQLKQVFDAIRELMTPPDPPKKRPIGFVIPEEKADKPKATKKLSVGKPRLAKPETVVESVLKMGAEPETFLERPEPKRRKKFASGTLPHLTVSFGLLATA